MLASWPHHDALDPSRIGMFGFSAGGFTALVAIGGTPDLTPSRPIAPPIRTIGRAAAQGAQIDVAANMSGRGAELGS